MVNLVSSISPVNVTQTGTKQNEVKTLVKYLNNEALEQAPDTFVSCTKSAGGSALLFEGIPLLTFLKNSKKTGGKFISDEMKNLGSQNKAALKNIFKGEGKLTERLANFAKTADETNKTYMDLRSATKAGAKSIKLSDKAAKLAEKAAANPDNKLLQKLASRAQEKATAAATKAASTAATQTAATGAKAVGKLGKFGKFMKNSGAGFMLAFSGIIEGVTEIIPTFKELGKEKGIKQVGKSALKIAGDTFGFIAGQKLGVYAGSAIGTAICPGIGTAIGAVCGFIGGMFGSWVAGKAVKAVTGKSEREKAAEEQAKQNAELIANNEQSLEEIKAAALAKIEEEAMMNNGELSKDSLIAYEALQNLDLTNPYLA